jgi:hypothetical protein
MSRRETSLVVGRAKTTPTAPTHVPGVNQGNAPHAMTSSDGFVEHPDGTTTGTARRSTSINPSDRDPIDPRMPNLSPP